MGTNFDRFIIHPERRFKNHNFLLLHLIEGFWNLLADDLCVGSPLAHAFGLDHARS